MTVTGCGIDEGDPEVSQAVAAVTVCGTSLQAAINAAPQDAVLEICAGTYRERLVIDGKRLELRGVSSVTTIDAGAAGRALIVPASTRWR